MTERSNSEINELVLKNQGLVRYVVEKKFNISYDDFDDFISIGNLGLIKAARTFDKSKNIKFATYATICIQNEILMFLRKQKTIANEISLDDPIGNDGEGNEITLLDRIPSANKDFTEILAEREVFIRFIDIILNLPNPRERLITLYTISGVNQHFIGKTLNISQSYVSRLQKRLREKLKSYLNDRYYFKEVFSMTIQNDLYRISFSSNDVKNFNKIFVDFLRNLKSIKDLSDFKIVCNKDRISIFLPAELGSFLFVAKIMQEIDNFSITYVSDKTILDTYNETEKNEFSTVLDSHNLVSNYRTSQNVNENTKPKKKKTYIEQVTEYILTLDSFSTSQVIQHFPNIPYGSVKGVLQYAKHKGLIKSTTRGNYEVISNKDNTPED